MCIIEVGGLIQLQNSNCQFSSEQLLVVHDMTYINNMHTVLMCVIQTIINHNNNNILLCLHIQHTLYINVTNSTNPRFPGEPWFTEQKHFHSFQFNSFNSTTYILIHTYTYMI